jgi:DNA polymerase I-like protein with 3'-5' exonuclease and polymerase domains
MKMDKEFLTYAALDSACTIEIHDKCWASLQGTFGAAIQLTMKILPVLMFMQTRGVKVNKAALEETKIDIKKTIALKQEELNAICGRPLNVNSPKQCQDYFYRELGIPPYKGKSGTPTVDDLALQRLVRGTATRPGLRQAKLVQEIRGLEKLFGTYLNIEFDADGRMRGSYNPRGTKYGRLSSSKTIFGTGMNFQNLPQEFKKFLEADDGYVLMEVDKRQAEWVAVAYLTGDANMLAAVENGVDVHVHTAMGMFGVTEEIVKLDAKLVGHSSDPEYIRDVRINNHEILQHYSPAWPRTMSLRQCGKKSNHGLNYDEREFGFALINEIEIKEAKRVVDLYHKLYPGIRIWYEWIKNELKKDRTLTNCFGRAVRFLGKWGDELWKSAYSMLPQSTVVDGLNEGMERIYADDKLCGIDNYNIDVLAQVHDSILMQVPIKWLREREHFDLIRSKIVDYTSPDMTYNMRTFKIASDFKFGMNWGEEHKERNPRGMTDVDSYDEFISVLNRWENGEGTQQLA